MPFQSGSMNPQKFHMTTRLAFMLVSLLVATAAEAAVSDLTQEDNDLAAKAAARVVGDTIHLYEQTAGECQVVPPCSEGLYLNRTARFSRALTARENQRVHRVHHVSCASPVRSSVWTCRDSGTTAEVVGVVGPWFESRNQDGSPAISDEKLIQLAKFGASPCFADQVASQPASSRPANLRVVGINHDAKTGDYVFQLPLEFYSFYFVLVRDSDAGDAACPFEVKAVRKIVI